MYAFDSDPIYLYQSGYMYGPVAINAKVAEKAVSDSNESVMFFGFRFFARFHLVHSCDGGNRVKAWQLLSDMRQRF
jgi:hypothetical protein